MGMSETPKKTGSRVKKVGDHVQWKIETIRSGSPSVQKSAMAQLRKCVGKSIGESPEIWKYTIEGMDSELIGIGGKASFAEEAVFAAMTLIGTHQRGNTNWMDKRGVGLGDGLRTLKRFANSSSSDTDMVQNRFVRAIQATTCEELVDKLYGLIVMLSNNGIGIDYPQLAEDLYRYQLGEEARESVKLNWARQIGRSSKKDEKQEEESNVSEG
jgi:CRISPR type I-E-associated protein CasB/Cse2